MINRPYSIGYCDLGDALRAKISIANMYNRAGYLVSPTADSVTVAAIKVTTYQPQFYQDIADSPSNAAWPLAGFTFYVLRMNHHIGDCNRRTRAMEYLYNFYYSDAATIVMAAKGFANLPAYYRDIVTNHMVNNIVCNATGELALAKYKLISYSLLGNVVLSITLQNYVAAYNNIDPTMLWQEYLNDDSLSNWNHFVANPDSTVGIFTLFPSAAQKLEVFSPVVANVSTSSFATLAVVPIYHLDAFTMYATSPLRVTPDIIAGIYSGTIKYWNDTLIKAANAENAQYLPYKRITVVVRPQPSDVTSVFSRYLAIHSPLFRSTYGITNVDMGTRYLNYSRVLDPNFFVERSGEIFVDLATLFQDGAFAYWMQTGSPSSFLATFCPDANCNTQINPSDISFIQNCAADQATQIFLPGSDVSALVSSDLMISTAPNCYPIVGTLDWSIYSTSNNCPSPDITRKRVQFTSWLYGDPSTVQPLTSIDSLGSNLTVRAEVFSRTCHISCDGTMLGFEYCNYRWCSFADGDFIQVVSSCDPGTEQRTVTYELTPPNNTCLRNSMYEPKQPVYIKCDFIVGTSAQGSTLTGLAAAGFSLTIVLAPFAFFTPKARRNHDYLFQIMFVGGAAFLHLSIYLLQGSNSKENCVLRPWCINAAASVMLAPLIMKLNRYYVSILNAFFSDLHLL